MLSFLHQKFFSLIIFMQINAITIFLAHDLPFQHLNTCVEIIRSLIVFRETNSKIHEFLILILPFLLGQLSESLSNFQYLIVFQNIIFHFPFFMSTALDQQLSIVFIIQK